MSIAAYPRVLQYAPNLRDALETRGYDIPPWLPLGWWLVESGGNIEDATTSQGRELGLAQLSSSERSLTGYTDEAALSSDPDYNVGATLALIDGYGGRVAAAGVDSSHDPLYWILIKFAHSIGAGGMEALVRNYVNTHADPSQWSWADFQDFSRSAPFKSLAWTDRWLDNADRVRTNGLALAAAANLVPPVGGPVAGWVPFAILTGAALWALSGRA